MKSTALVGRLLFSALFLFSFPGHFKHETIAFSAAQGVPLASLLVPASGILELVGALSIILGYRARWGAAALIAFLIPVTFMMHPFWSVSDPMGHQIQFVMFMKNISLVGAALMIVQLGAGAYSLDARTESRKPEGRRTAAVAA
ncbi:MAG: DoxX family protein [Kofleriaceae bacterium]|nr:DoxX family protein [Kofleriaceae bacterium]